MQLFRDEKGWGWLEMFIEPDCPESEIFNVAAAQGFVADRLFLEDDLNAPASLNTQVRNGNLDLSSWEPTAPEGEGWFLAIVNGNVACPYAVFIKKKEGNHAGQN